MLRNSHSDGNEQQYTSVDTVTIHKLDLRSFDIGSCLLIYCASFSQKVGVTFSFDSSDIFAIHINVNFLISPPTHAYSLSNVRSPLSLSL